MINLNVADTVIVAGTPQVTNCNMDDLNKNKDCGPVQIHTSYINYLAHDVCVISRNGLRHIVPMVPTRGAGKFIVRTRYTIEAKTFETMKRLFVMCREHDMPDMLALEEAFYASLQHKSFGTVIATVDTTIDKAVLDRAQGHVYLSNSDVVLSRATIWDAPPHPFASHAKVLAKYTSMIDASSG